MTKQVTAKSLCKTLLCLTLLLTLCFPVQATDLAHKKKADASIARGIAFLKSTQAADGSWTPQPGPGITALAMQVMIQDPNTPKDDPHIRKALAYILSKVNKDGSISDGFLNNYNTSICLSALSQLKGDPQIDQIIKNAQNYLKGIQWVGQKDPNGKVIDKKHPFYGGAGYGKHGRPDMSNTQFMIQALHDSGLTAEDEAFQRALVFVSRHQGISSNDMFDTSIINQDGGFIYANSINKDLIGVPSSKASPEAQDEAKLGKPVSGLRTYGSMTYAGFKSLLYAGLKKDDPRVQAAMGWICDNYDFSCNPGMPEKVKLQGLYYYFMAAGRALNAWGQAKLVTVKGERDWGNDLIDKLGGLQKKDGSWSNSADRWMEGDPNLVTAYSVMTLLNCK